jgi:predicted RNA binding protein YcfA (HicA-like mRNA interferase family)
MPNLSHVSEVEAVRALQRLGFEMIRHSFRGSTAAA